ncbi:NAD-dependent malic enzyme [Legionella sp. W05-934-2]|jgi:malate dehydrogenase (oxaloacetate-decarboxylating)|uniref:NAD-dependent malic enzyme n=1 Tax=Legionella sp. W05-934-2 TaxID=1198649 RepID=UPI0034624D48
MPKMIANHGHVILRDPLLNKGTAFTQEERNLLELNGLLPPHIESLDEQVQRSYEAFGEKVSDLQKHIYLRALQDTNETLFYRLIQDHLEEMMPIIYTPTVGDACELFHHIYRKPRGLFLAYPDRAHLDSILAATAARMDVRVIVVTDGERILGLGDQGAGGMGIPIGKLSLYIACGGINPSLTLPIILDVGTNNQARLDCPEYLGWRHKRVTGEEYDKFVDQFVQGVKTHFPHALLQFEDFAQQHAYPLLKKYQDKLCTFNDDIQGTAAVSVAAIVAATRVANVPLKEMNVCVVGAGSAGCGIAEQLVQVMVNQGLSPEEARQHFFMVDRHGLVHNKMSDLMPFQQLLAQDVEHLKQLDFDPSQEMSLLDVVDKAKPGVLLGVSGVPGLFTEDVIKTMAKHQPHPIVFPLSNPTSRAEAVPKDILTWTNGKALVATGSPFDPVTIGSQTIPIAQCNNAYIFPGMGLAVVASQAKRVTNTMMMAAALALSDLAPAVMTGKGRLLPELHTIREVSRHIAEAVIKQGIKEGHIHSMDEAQIQHAINETMWVPEYKEY